MISNELLKKKILDEAIHGRLVENNPSLKPIDVKSINDDLPFEVPNNWKWAKFSNLAECRMGKTILAENLTDNGIPVYSATQENKIFGFVKNSELVLHSGDIVIPARGNSIGYATYILDKEATCTQTTICCQNIKVLSKYLYFCCYAFKSLWFHFTGAAIPQITVKQLNKNLVPLPPLEEQEKIVKKIEKLFELIDKKEKNDKEKEKLKTLLKEKILDSAIRGKLIENDLSLPAVDVEEVNKENPFEIPINWKWSHIKCIGDVIGGGTPRTGNNEYWNGNINWITPADMKSTDKYITKGKKSITEKGLIESSARLMPKGTIIISSRAPIGYVKISNEPISTSQGCKSVVINNPEILNEYIFYYIKSIANYLNELGTGTTFKEISGKTLGNVLVNIPPLEQQKRIVDKIEKCFELIEQL